MKDSTNKWVSRVLLTVFACFLVSACSPPPPPSPLAIAEGQLLAELAQFRRNIEQRDQRKTSYDYWSGKVIAASAANRKAQAEREYDKLASSGAYGTREQLIGAKRQMDVH